MVLHGIVFLKKYLKEDDVVALEDKWSKMEAVSRRDIRYCSSLLTDDSCES